MDFETAVKEQTEQIYRAMKRMSNKNRHKPEDAEGYIYLDITPCTYSIPGGRGIPAYKTVLDTYLAAYLPSEAILKRLNEDLSVVEEKIGVEGVLDASKHGDYYTAADNPKNMLLHMDFRQNFRSGKVELILYTNHRPVVYEGFC